MSMALSLDLRKRIINAYKKREGSIRKLAERFSVNATSVWKLLKRSSKGEGIEAKSPPGRNPLINEAGLKIISELLRKNNDATLEKLREEFWRKTRLKVGMGTMHRACQRLKISYKKNAISC
jgi:transposase